MTKLKKIMKSKQVTISSLSEKTGISMRTIENYTSGSRNINNAKFKAGILLARALEVEPEELIED